MNTQWKPPLESLTGAVPERHTRDFLAALKEQNGPPLESLSPSEARAVLTGAQTSVSPKLAPAEILEKTITIDGVPISLIIVHPGISSALLPAFMFFHGGGWVLGDFPTHERLVRDLVAYSGAIAVFVEYSRSPEARYPTAVNQVFEATRWVAEHGEEFKIDKKRLAVAGNSVGGNLAAVTALRCALEGGPKLRCQLLLWPVTDAGFETESYREFEQGYFLTRPMMRWFWDNYAPRVEDRNQVYASPLRATEVQLKGLPAAIIQTAELDVLRDEGEAYARALDRAGVEVTALRMNGMIHDYGLLNPLANVPAVQAALRQAGSELKRHLE